MKYLITIVIAALSFNAFSQGIPQLPYNPDENGDGLIGVPDLQGLLSLYSLEFNSAILSDDGENAVVNLGDMSYPECAASCRNLTGFWSVASLEDLGLVWNTVNSNTWLKREKGAVSTTYLYFYNTLPFDIASQYISSAKCYCAAHEIPKVEYKVLYVTNTSTLESVYNEAAQEGWRLLPAAEGASQRTTMWRWAND